MSVKINTLTLHGQIARYDGVLKATNDAIDEMKTECGEALFEVQAESDRNSGIVNGFEGSIQDLRDVIGYSPIHKNSGTVGGTWKNGFRIFENVTFKGGVKYYLDVTLSAAQPAGGYIYYLLPDGTQRGTTTFAAGLKTLRATITYTTDTTITAVCGWGTKGFTVSAEWYISDRSTRLDIDKKTEIISESIDMLAANGEYLFDPMYFGLGNQTQDSTTKVIKFNPTTYCVGSMRSIRVKNDMKITIADGYRLYIWFVNENDVATRNSGWVTGEYSLKAGDLVWICIDADPRDTTREATLYGDLTKCTISAPAIVDIDRRLDALENADFEFATEFHTEEDAFCRNIRDDVDSKTLVFLLSTDDHYNDTNTSSGGNLMIGHARTKRRLAEKLGVDFMINLGDIIDEDTANGNGYRIDAMRKAYTSTYIPFLYALGHHEMYPTVSHSHQGHEDNVTTFTYESNKVLGKLGRYSRYIKEIHYSADPASASYYVDFEKQKIRLIVLDSVHNTYCGFTLDVVAFCREAFANVPAGYKVIIAAHVPSRANANWSHVAVQNGDKIESIIETFISGGGKVLGYFHGHVHWDNIVKDADMHFSLIATSCGRPSYTPPSGEYVKDVSGNPIAAANRVGDGLREYCCDVVCVHPDNNTVKLFRWGCSGNGTSSAVNGIRTITT